MKNLIHFLFIIAILLFAWFAIDFCLPVGALAEETTTMYVNTSVLNGREFPSMKSFREAFFEQGETVQAIELNNTGWVLCEGGETGVVWCKAEYLSESETVRKWKNISGGSVNVRRNPSIDSRRVGKIKAGRTVYITAEVFGWGYIKSQGWVDLEFFEVIEENE